MRFEDRLLIILSPVYNDWQSYSILVKNGETVLRKSGFTNFKFIAVDDCSSEEYNVGGDFHGPNVSQEIIELSRNVGHQKAIAIGLSYIFNTYPNADVIVMDSDGEDNPEHLVNLIRKGHNNEKIVFAQRNQRSEGAMFKFFYNIYKRTYKLLTGQVIDFGNFSFIPNCTLYKVVNLSEIWNHYAVGVMRAKLAISKVLLDRGKRYAGKSKMNFSSLIIHGLSAISVYSDVVAIRLIMFSLLSILVCAIGISIIFCIKVFTNLAIPGWTSNIILGLVIIIFQAFFMALFLAFSVLANRSQVGFIPSKGYHHFINNVRK